MSRSRALVALLAVLAVMAVVAPVASAQEDPTTVPPITLPGLPTTTAPPDTLPPQPPPPPTTAPIVDDPAAGGDAPPEPVPQSTDTVPPRTDAIAPGDLPPVRGQVLTLDVQGAKAASDKAQQDLADATAERTQLEATVKSLTDSLAALGETGRQAVADLASARTDMTQHAVDAYVRGSDATLAVSGFDDSSLVESTLLAVLVSRDDAAVKRYDDLKRSTTQARVTTAEQLARAQQQLGQARAAEKQAQVETLRTKFAMAVTTAGGNVVIDGFVFPVAPPYSFSDSFGAPRLPGTPQEHWHMGTDIAAAEGQALLAAERGIITQISGGGLGGNGIWLRGESGVAYYYAHLSSYADVNVGQVVDAGTVLGFVGHTGDAAASGPHLHFEIHPNGGDAIDPYPLLKAADPTGSAR